MFKEHPVPTIEQLAEAAKLREQAKQKLNREEESFQRCDTDGFLSQWALNIGARKDEANAKILEHGGCARFPVLVDADDNVVSTEICTFENEWPVGTVRKWKLSYKDVDRFGKRWIPVGSNSRIQKKLGLRESDRWFPAYADIWAPGRGLSGAAAASVQNFKKGERK